MPYFDFVWTEEIIAHLAEHDISPDDFEHVVMNPQRTGKSRSSGDPAVWGYTQDGRYIIAVPENRLWDSCAGDRVPGTRAAQVR